MKIIGGQIMFTVFPTARSASHGAAKALRFGNVWGAKATVVQTGDDRLYNGQATPERGEGYGRTPAEAVQAAIGTIFNEPEVAGAFNELANERASSKASRQRQRAPRRPR